MPHADADRRMVERQIRSRGVRSERVLDAMATVPRSAFVPDHLQAFAHADGPLPIGEGQTISQPYIVAVMIDAMVIEPADQVLEVGGGSGYAAAILGQLADRVDTIERHATLAASASARMRTLGYENIHVHCGDGAGGLPERAPFDAILVSAGGPTIPPALLEQLRIGGRLVIPVGPRSAQRLLRVRRIGPSRYETDGLGRVQFVPLITDSDPAV